jgi:hypothetical protein
MIAAKVGIKNNRLMADWHDVSLLQVLIGA